MYSSFESFKNNLFKSNELIVLYDYTSNNLKTMNFDDLLRAYYVYSVSAFDKFMHDIIRIGMIEIFQNKRLATKKYLNEPIPIEIYNQIKNSTSSSLPPDFYYFENEITRKLSFISYQHPNKISDGLSYIWDEDNKWQKISDKIGQTKDTVKKTLINMVSRRNQIVHEADMDLSTGEKYKIEKIDADKVGNFIYSCGHAIYSLVKI